MNTDRAESLFLTVSGNHEKRDYPEYILAMCRPYLDAGGMVSAYEGAMLGGADMIFGLDELNLWIRRHRFAKYNMSVLMSVTHVCLEYAVRTKISAERPGIPSMAAEAARLVLRDDPALLRSSSRGWLHIRWLSAQFPDAVNDESRQIIARFRDFRPDVPEYFEALVRQSSACENASALVQHAQWIYKEIFMKYFAPPHDDDPLPELAVPDDDIPRSPEEEEKPDPDSRRLTFSRRSAATDDEVILNEADLASIPAYLEDNFGPSFKTASEMDEIERAVCTGIHEERRLLFTDGLPESVYTGDSRRSRSAIKCREANRGLLREQEAAVRAGIRNIELAFRNALNLRSDPETFSADSGVLVNSRLWKADRCSEPQLFEKTIRQDQSRIAVELLIDASGSQSVRQSMVALQSYMFSTALSRVGIPHRVMSYCTYGDHTVLRRFRDYDDSGAADIRILDYSAASNNRDGLAFAAAGLDLLKRREEHKIMIIFSDGLPNDMVSGRVRAGKPKKYVGDTAVRDTCFAVRKLSGKGVRVLGVFLGEDGELENERLIYGASFLRIRRADDFGGSAGRRLREMLL